MIISSRLRISAHIRKNPFGQIDCCSKGFFTYRKLREIALYRVVHFKETGNSVSSMDRIGKHAIAES